MGISIKLKFRPSQLEGREGALFFQLIHNRMSYQHTTNHKILPSEWDARRSVIIIPPASNPRRDVVMKIRRRVRWELVGLTKLANRILEDNESTTVDEVLEQWRDVMAQQPFFTFMQSVIGKQTSSKKEGTARKYRSAMNSFEHFIESQDLMLFEITSELIEEYQQWLIDNEACMNTVSFYMRILRAVFNRAVKQRLVAQTNPFADVYTGVAETRKRAIDLDRIQRIKDVELGGDKNLELARDFFLLSFYCRGMAFVDMAYLKKDNIVDGLLTYNRQKTKQQILIKMEPPIQEIIDKYATDSQYLLPIIKETDEPVYEQYMRMNKNVCRWLKAVGKMANIDCNLTIYVARHSWTSIAKQRNHQLGTISRALGHTSERTTHIYLVSLDNSAVDEANRDILCGLK